MSSREYVFVTTTNKYYNTKVKVIKRFTIKCIGGECMTKEKPKLVFVDNSEIPAKATRKGEAWLELFNQIPVGKSLVVDESKYKVPTIKGALAKLKKEGKIKANIKVVQRLNAEKKKITYVMNVAPE